MRRHYWALLVTWKDGIQDYMCDGLGDRVSRFRSKAAAEEKAAFLRVGLDSEDRVHVVPMPRVVPADLGDDCDGDIEGADY